MPPAKFQIGDRVRFTNRANNVAGRRKMTRKIVNTFYSKGLQASLYELGGRGGKHGSGQWHRSYELYPVNELQSRKIGQPSTKVIKALRVKRQAHQATKQVPQHLEEKQSHVSDSSQALRQKSERLGFCTLTT